MLISLPLSPSCPLSPPPYLADVTLTAGSRDNTKSYIGDPSLYNSPPLTPLCLPPVIHHGSLSMRWTLSCASLLPCLHPPSTTPPPPLLFITLHVLLQGSSYRKPQHAQCLQQHFRPLLSPSLCTCPSSSFPSLYPPRTALLTSCNSSRRPQHVQDSQQRFPQQQHPPHLGSAAARQQHSRPQPPLS